MPSQSVARSRKAGGAQRTRAADAGDTTKGMQHRSWGRLIGIVGSASSLIVALAGAAWWVLREQLPGTGPAIGITEESQGNATTPTVYTYRVIRTHHHDPEAFTQGLFWLNGTFYESTGLYGKSVVREVSLDGKVVREVRLGKRDFGEGLVYWKGELLQLLWRVGNGYRFSAKAGPGGHLRKKKQAFKTPFNDGWGFAEDGESLLITDSGPDVCFLDPESFRSRRCVRVRDAGRAVEMVNELEMIDGELWANIFGKECIARIAPETGQVLGWVDLTGILDRRAAHAEAMKHGRQPPDVLNGIAWDAEGRRLFVTGKLFPYLFEIEVVPVENPDIEHVRHTCIPKENVFGPMKEP